MIGRIDWAAVNFAFVLVMTLLTAFAGYAYLNGSTANRMARLESDVAELRAAVREIQKRGDK